jgi:UDP-2,3-diacylglucosamine hydrolase
MNLIAVSDLHLNPGSPERNQEFLNLLQESLSNGDEILILGDLFDLWFGRDALTFAFQKPILARMQELASQGLKMDYVEGNRDFAIRQYSPSLFRNVASTGYSRTWGMHRIYAEHGDLINKADRPYRFFRKLTKNPLSLLLLKHMPARFFLGRADRLEKQMKSTNMRHKMSYPESYCRTFAEKKGIEGADLVIIGHFHEEKSWSLKGSNQNVLFFNLPGWESGIRYLVIPQTNQAPYFEERGSDGHSPAS